MEEYKYEVAFSFLKDDENLAWSINDRIQDRLSTFIYSKKQEELAGKDGEESFNKVFGEDARIVVVLYRSNWGTTPWTRIEETAIRNRAYEEGYDFTLFIPLDESPTIPKWLPKTQIWANIKRWGVDGAATIIESKVQQAGGKAQEESLEDHALRLKRQIDFEKEKKEFLKSELGVKAANGEVEKIVEAMILRINNISAETEMKFRIHQNEGGYRWVEVYSKFHCISIDWHYSYQNTLENSQLAVELWEGVKLREDRYSPMHRNSQKILERTLYFDRNQSGKYCWSDRYNSFESEQLVEYCVKLLIDYSYKKELSILQ